MKNVKKIAAVALVLCLVLSCFAACSFTPAAKLVGSWRDSTGVMGYEFQKDGICVITYANFTIPVVNIPFNGTVNGTYTTQKADDGSNTVTINYTIFTNTISTTYKYSVDKSVLSLTDVETGTAYSLAKYTPETSAPASSAQ